MQPYNHHRALCENAMNPFRLIDDSDVVNTDAEGRYYHLKRRGGGPHKSVEATTMGYWK